MLYILLLCQLAVPVAADDAPLLQAKLTEASADWESSWRVNDAKVLKLDRDYTISKPLRVPADVIIEGDATITAARDFEGRAMLELEGRAIQRGQLAFVGNGKVRSAIRGYNIGRSKFESLSFDKFPGWAFEVLPKGNNNQVNASIQGVRCGQSKAAQFRKVSDEGSVGSYSQRSKLAVDAPPDTHVVRIDKTLHLVVERTADSITVFPFAPDAGRLTYVSGGVLSTGPHNDTNVWDLELNAIACPGTALAMRTLYGHNVRHFSAEACGIGVIFGAGITSPTVNGLLTLPYFEASRVADTLMLAENSFITILEPMDAGGDKYESLLYARNGYTIIRQGGVIKQTLAFKNRFHVVGAVSDEPRYYFENTGKIEETTLRLHVPNKSGAGKCEVYLRGYGKSKFVIAAPVGFTVEGASEHTIAKPPDGKVEIVLIGTDYKVFR